MLPRPMSPDNTEDRHKEQQQTGHNSPTTLPGLPQPRDIYATLASTLSQAMDAGQYSDRFTKKS